MLLHERTVYARSVYVETFEVRRGHELYQVVIPSVITREEDEARGVLVCFMFLVVPRSWRDEKIDADNRLHALLHAFFVKLYSTIHVAVVGQSKRALAVGFRRSNELFNFGEGFEKGIVRMGVQVQEISRHARIIPELTCPPPLPKCGPRVRYDEGVQWYIGVDEAGRGALAGPVCVGAVLLPEDFDWHEVFALVTKRGQPKLRDSKKLSAQQRATLYEYIVAHGRLRHAHALVDSETIDSIGIVNATHEAASVAVSSLGISQGRVKVLLDAGLKLSAAWEQESFIRGDENIPAIALASIIAKVSRDRFMDELAGSHERYGFEQHKGYGTLDHRRAIHSFGQIAGIHRSSFVH